MFSLHLCLYYCFHCIIEYSFIVVVLIIKHYSCEHREGYFFKTSNFSCAESNANEPNLLLELIYIRFGTWKVRRSNLASTARVYPPPIIIRIFLNKSILKSLLGLHLKANVHLLIFLSDNVATILTDWTIRVERDLSTSVQMNVWLSNHCVVGMTLL